MGVILASRVIQEVKCFEKKKALSHPSGEGQGGRGSSTPTLGSWRVAAVKRKGFL